MYDSVYKFIYFTLTVNFVTMIFIFMGAVLFDQTVLAPAQILWMCVITNGLAIFIFGTDLPRYSMSNYQAQSQIKERLCISVSGQVLF